MTIYDTLTIGECDSCGTDFEVDRGSWSGELYELDDLYSCESCGCDLCCDCTNHNDEGSYCETCFEEEEGSQRDESQGVIRTKNLAQLKVMLKKYRGRQLNIEEKSIYTQIRSRLKYLENQRM